MPFCYKAWDFHSKMRRIPKNSSTRYEVQIKFNTHAYNFFLFFFSPLFVFFFSCCCCYSPELWAKNVNARGTISVSYHLKYRWYRYLFANAQCRSNEHNRRKKKLISTIGMSRQRQLKKRAKLTRTIVKKVYIHILTIKSRATSWYHQTSSRHYNIDGTFLNSIRTPFVRHMARNTVLFQLF